MEVTGMGPGYRPPPVAFRADGWSATHSMSRRRRSSAPRRSRIDPFTLTEPWRRLVQDSLAAEIQFHAAVRRARSGPLRDRLADLGDRLGDGVVECWQVGQAGHALSRARSGIDLLTLRRELAELGGTADIVSATAVSIQARIEAAERIDATIAQTRAHLRLLNARLGEAVIRAVEVSVSTTTATDELSSIGADLAAVTQQVEALRAGLESVDRLGDAG
jgi:hypothetical protein